MLLADRDVFKGLKNVVIHQKVIVVEFDLHSFGRDDQRAHMVDCPAKRPVPKGCRCNATSNRVISELDGAWSGVCFVVDIDYPIPDGQFVAG